jgi:outer membrane protein assembly factor BamD
MLGMSYYEMSPRASLDQEYTIKAMKAFQIFIEDYPLHEKREEVDKILLELREKLAYKTYDNAELYRKMLRFRSSLIYYDLVLERFYDSSWADDALLGKAQTYIELDDYIKAREQLLIFKDKFPNSDQTYIVDRLLREISYNLDAAVEK